ncbi:tandem-95 repeat protein [Amphritea balenae]|uniref:Tandem-95 repeat protein n=1 Tax=Amphritea balenae TaxID=452629 RepID=A0A3P1SS56_9GAMM|nr:tandem-95 repeat protein [Amphritea balenae]RRD00017.1 tandem-95 repeat protein [Amphritea balenae]GGK75889.1 hypothetical protein GCM10007941_27560 [Amphritea balenae]
MSGSIVLTQNNGELITADLNASQQVDLTVINSVSLPFNRTDIQSLEFDGDALTLTLSSGENIEFTAFTDAEGTLVPVYQENGSLLFDSIAELLSELNATAAGPEQTTTKISNGSGFTPADEQSEPTTENSNSYRNLREALDGPSFINQAFTEATEVLAANQAPIAENESFSYNEAEQENGLLTGNLLVNDSDIDSPSIAISSVEGLPLNDSSVTVTLATGVQVTVFQNGLFVVLNHKAVYGDLSEAETVFDQLNYEVSDGISSSSAVMDFSVTGTNDAPAIGPIEHPDVNEDDAAFTINLLDGATDAEGDALSIEHVTITAVDNRPVIFTEQDGVINIDPSQFNNLPEKAELQLTINYQVSDQQDSTANTATVIITGTNDAPAIGPIEHPDVNEDDAAFTINLLDGATDVEGDALSIEQVSVTAADNRPVIFTEQDGVLSIDPSQFNNLPEKAELQLTINYQVSDQQDSTVNTATVIITGTNDAPAIGPIEHPDVNEDDAAFTINLLDGATDAEGDALSIEHVTITAVDNRPVIFTEQDGVINIDPSQFNNLPEKAELQLTINYQVSDQQDSTANTATVTVIGSYDALMVGDRQFSNTEKNSSANLILNSKKLWQQGILDSDNPDTNYKTVNINDDQVHSPEITAIRLPEGVTYQTLGFASEQEMLNEIVSGLQVVNRSKGSDYLKINYQNNFDFLAKGEQAEIDIQYQLETLSSESSGPLTATLVIGGLNAGHKFIRQQGDQLSKNLTESDQALHFEGTMSIADADLNDTHSLSVVKVIAHTTQISNPDLLNMLSLSTDKLAEIKIDAGQAKDQFIWNFDAAPQSFDFLSAGQKLVIAYSLKLSQTDGLGKDRFQTIRVQIRGTNDKPEISLDESSETEFSFNEDDTGTLAGGNFSVQDIDVNDTVTVKVSSVKANGPTGGMKTSALLKMLSIIDGNNIVKGETEADYEWQFSAKDSQFDFLPAGKELVLTYTIQARDSAKQSDTQQIKITISGTNDAPVIAENFVLSATINDTATSKVISPITNKLWRKGKIGDVDSNHSVKQLDVAKDSVQIAGLEIVDDSGNPVYSEADDNHVLNTLGLDRASLTTQLQNDLIIVNKGNSIKLDLSDAGLATLPRGVNLKISLQYKITDGIENSNAAEAEVTVKGTSQLLRIDADQIIETDGITSLSLDNAIVDIDALINNKFIKQSINHIDLTGDGENTLSGLEAADVLSLTNDQPLLIEGDTEDHVLLKNPDAWSNTGVQNIDGISYNVFTLEGAIVKIDTDIDTNADIV